MVVTTLIIFLLVVDTFGAENNITSMTSIIAIKIKLEKAILNETYLSYG